ncbi:MAG: carboxypeptidase-like regulatory domain-containing protein [Planctomycetota bacterium]
MSSAGSLGSTQRGLTDMRGTAVLDGLVPGRCRITVRRGFEVLAEREVTIAPGQNRELQIEVSL